MPTFLGRIGRVFRFLFPIPLFIIRTILGFFHWLSSRTLQKRVREEILPFTRITIPSEADPDSSESASSPARSIFPLTDFPHLEETMMRAMARGFLHEPLVEATLCHANGGEASLFDPSHPTQDGDYRDAVYHFLSSYLLAKSAIPLFIADASGDAEGILRGGSIWSIRHNDPTVLELYDGISTLLQFGVPLSMLSVLDQLEETGKLIMSDVKGDYYHLLIHAIDPQSQSKGYGTNLLRPILNLADEREIVCYAVSTNPRNVPFYQRCGFEIKERMVVLEKVNATFLRREPQEIED